MHFDWKQYGIYPILAFLLRDLILFLYHMSFGIFYGLQRVENIFGPFPYLFILLVFISTIATLSNFGKKWLFALIPFLWIALMPFKRYPNIDPDPWGVIFWVKRDLLRIPIAGIEPLLTGLPYYLLIASFIGYLTLKQAGKFKEKWEVPFAVVSAILLIVIYS